MIETEQTGITSQTDEKEQTGITSQTDEKDAFFRGLDFLRLGRAINEMNRSAALVIIKRMTERAEKLALSDIAAKLGRIKGCMLSGNKQQALNAMAGLTAVRVNYLNKCGQPPAST